jgi:hypothetical protein
MESSGVAGGVTDGENYLKRCSPVLKGYRECGRSAIATNLMIAHTVIASASEAIHGARARLIASSLTLLAMTIKNPPEKTPADHCHLAMRKASYAFIAGV